METTRHDPIDFFLGATTPAGFKGYFEPPVSYTHLTLPTIGAV